MRHPDARPWWVARGRRAPGPTTRETRSRLPVRCVPLTCSSDGRTHYVDDEVFAGGFGGTVGLCGHAVVVAALVAPPGPTCPGCRDAVPVDDAVHADETGPLDEAG